ncbi:GAF domain-containing protein [Nocardia sp. NPDC003963]
MAEPVRHNPDPGSVSAAGPRLHSNALRPWVLVETLGGPADDRRVIAEGVHPRRYTRLTRTRIAGSSAVAQHLPAVVDAAVTSGESQARIAYPPSGTHVRIVAVPVTGPSGAVHAVQVWAGPRTQSPPERPQVGTVLWRVPGNGISCTSAVVEDMLDTGISAPAERALPDLLRHFEWLDNRAELLQLFDPSAAPGQYSGFAVTSGEFSQARRTLYLVARAYGSAGQRSVAALVTDVSLTRPVPRPAIATRLIDALPTPHEHGIGVIDVRTGLVHEWVRRGRAPLDRWMNEIPTVHTDDLAQLSTTRARLLAGADSARCSWRLRFDERSPWTRVHAQWDVLIRDPTPQALLDIHLSDPDRFSGGADPY